MAGRRSYTTDEREGALRAASELAAAHPGMSLHQLAQEIGAQEGIPPSTLRGWLRQRAAEAGAARIEQLRRSLPTVAYRSAGGAEVIDLGLYEDRYFPYELPAGFGARRIRDYGVRQQAMTEITRRSGQFDEAAMAAQLSLEDRVYLIRTMNRSTVSILSREQSLSTVLTVLATVLMAVAVGSAVLLHYVVDPAAWRDDPVQVLANIGLGWVAVLLALLPWAVTLPQPTGERMVARPRWSKVQAVVADLSWLIKLLATAVLVLVELWVAARLHHEYFVATKALSYGSVVAAIFLLGATALERSAPRLFPAFAADPRPILMSSLCESICRLRGFQPHDLNARVPLEQVVAETRLADFIARDLFTAAAYVERRFTGIVDAPGARGQLATCGRNIGATLRKRALLVQLRPLGWHPRLLQELLEDVVAAARGDWLGFSPAEASSPLRSRLRSLLPRVCVAAALAGSAAAVPYLPTRWIGTDSSTLVAPLVVAAALALVGSPATGLVDKLGSAITKHDA